MMLSKLIDVFVKKIIIDKYKRNLNKNLIKVLIYEYMIITSKETPEINIFSKVPRS